MSAEGVTKAIWMHLLREGGRWSITELVTAMPGTNVHHVSTAVHRMALGGSVKRFEKAARGDVLQFGVTPECKVPHGVPLSELVAIGILKEAT